MALNSSNNFYSAAKGVMGLFSGVNKAKKGEDDDNGFDLILPEFTSKLKDDEIIKLTKEWSDGYETYVKDIKRQQKENVNYWIGKHYNELQTAGSKKPLVDNILFEAIETFLPIATRGNPQANVFGNGTEEGDKIADTVQKALEYQAERQQLRMKLKGMTRNWAIYMLGAVKVGWDSKENDIRTDIILTSRLVLDPNSYIDVNGVYSGEYLGEKKKCTARKLTKMFPDKASVISAKVQGNMGSKVDYIEWWTKTDVFFTLGHHVLGKFKNPHWNYDGETDITDPITGEVSKEQVEGINHLNSPQIPYVFLSIFSLGKQPHDETSLIQQNISLQDTINRRYQQIDRNVESQNNGVVLSGKYFTKEQASEAATQLQRGNPLWVPEGDIRAAYARDNAPSLSPDVFNHLSDARNELRNIFGTAGSSPEGQAEQDTVRGKIMINQMDSSRIGGGVTEYIEQVASTIYNWYVQMMYVYYTEEHSFAIVGPKTQEMMSIKNTDLNMKLHIAVKDGSLVPKDPLTKRNEAMDLWSAGAIAPIPFYTALDYPNPYESAKELLQWKLIEQGALPPTTMFPDLMEDMEGQMPPSPLAPNSGIVSGEEDNRTLSQQEVGVVGDSVAQDSRQLIQSMPI